MPVIRVRQIPFDRCERWSLRHGAIRHDTGRYFSVVCVEGDGREHILLDQPEVGLLAFVAEEGERDRRWLVQNKPEPGNVGYCQMAPTVQATRSNYECVHGGARTPYLELFQEGEFLESDLKASEQGDRFLGKFNRNAVRICPPEISVEDDPTFCWVRTSALKQGLLRDHTVNTDARSVLATAPWRLLRESGRRPFASPLLREDMGLALCRSYGSGDQDFLHRAGSLLRAVGREHGACFERVPLEQSRQYRLESKGIFGWGGEQVLAFFDVHMQDREVPHWCQPLYMHTVRECCSLVCAEVRGVLRFAIAAYPEVGFGMRVEFGPSLQSGQGRFKRTAEDLERLNGKLSVLARVEQSDEGGRFYRNRCLYTLGFWPGEPEDLPLEAGIWATAAELEQLCSHGLLSNELRTCVSLLLALL